MIHTFDIFDTCLTRRVANCCDIYEKYGSRLQLGESFKYIRQEAEREATTRYIEPTLLQIHEILSNWMGHDLSLQTTLINAELEEEARQIAPIPNMLIQINQIRNNGGRIAFISDMYLPSRFLRDQLSLHGFCKDEDLIIVSCEHGKSKASGDLYNVAKKLLGGHTWNHYGNHYHSDILAARRAGLNAIYRSESNLNRHEQIMLQWQQKYDCRNSTIWAGASRFARINSGARTIGEQKIADISASIAGPLVFIYATWLVEKAAALNLDYIYFLSRDGQIFIDAFNRIAEISGIKTRAKYLYVSRISVRFPVKFPLSEEDAAGVFQGNGMVPISVVSARLGVSEDKFKEWLPKKYYRNDIILHKHISEIRNILCKPEIADVLSDKATSRSELLRQYLVQEGFFDSYTPVIVDLGWNGTLQAGLQNALVAAGSKLQIIGFYLGLRSVSCPNSKSEALLYDCRNSNIDFPEWLTTVTELLCQADHGTTLRYHKKSDETICPILDELDGENAHVTNWFFIHRSTINHFVEELISNQNIISISAAYKRLLLRLLESFWLSPSSEEARIFGECSFSSDGLAKTRVTIAPYPNSICDFLHCLGIINYRSSNLIWPQGSLAKLPFLLQKFSVLCRKFRSLLRTIYRKFINF